LQMALLCGVSYHLRILLKKMSFFTIERIITNLSLILSFCSLLLISRLKSSEEQKLAFFSTVVSLILCAGYWEVLESKCQTMMIVNGTKLKYLGSFLLSMQILMTLAYFGFRIPIVVHVLTWGLIGFFSVLAFSFDHKALPWHAWLIQDFSITMPRDIPSLHRVNGWAYKIFMALAGAYAVYFTVGTVVTLLRHRSRRPAGTVLTLFLLVIIPLFCFFMEKSIIHIAQTDTVPVVPAGFTVSTLLFAYLLLVRRFCDVNNMASSIFFDTAGTPAIVINKHGRITNINEPARKAFQEFSRASMFRNISSVLPYELRGTFSRLLKDSGMRDGSVAVPSSATEVVERNGRVFMPKLRSIMTDETLFGYVLWLEDVTLIVNYKKDLEAEVTRKTKKLEVLRDNMVMGFAALAENHDMSCKGHLRRTAFYTQLIADELMKEGKYTGEINSRYVDKMRQVAPLHDIGKNYIDKGILEKQGKLTPAEFGIMTTHTLLGADFIERTLKETEDVEYYQMAHDVALYHHECWDGRGYPKGLEGSQIPLCARIMAVADVYDALTSQRPYKGKMPCTEALQYIKERAGTQFDPTIVQVLDKIQDRMEDISLYV